MIELKYSVLGVPLNCTVQHHAFNLVAERGDILGLILSQEIKIRLSYELSLRELGGLTGVIRVKVTDPDSRDLPGIDSDMRQLLHKCLSHLHAHPRSIEGIDCRLRKAGVSKHVFVSVPNDIATIR